METLADLGAIAAEWDDLADRAGASPFVRPGWIAAWADAFGGGPLELVALRRAGRLAGLVPVQRRAAGLRSPTNWHTPGFELLGEDEDAVGELAQALYALGGRSVRVAFLDPAGRSLAACRAAARASGHLLIERVLEHSPYVELAGGFEAYGARLDGKLRRDLRRRRRALEELGAVSVGLEDAGSLPDGLAVEASGWKGERGTAIAAGATTHRFYRAVAEWACRRGSLRLGFLRVDGRAIAFDFCLEEQGSHYLLKTGFDPLFRRFAPGKLLRLAMIERAFRAGLARYEFLGSADPWKHEWTDTVRSRMLLHSFKASPLGVAEWSAWALGRPLAKRALALAGR